MSDDLSTGTATMPTTNGRTSAGVLRDVQTWRAQSARECAERATALDEEADGLEQKASARRAEAFRLRNGVPALAKDLPTDLAAMAKPRAT